jgi:hypothetical protein
MKRRVIFPDPNIWTQKDNTMSYGEHLDRIRTTPFTPIPQDTVIVAGPPKLMLGPSPDGRIDPGLLIECPPPIGSIRIALTGDMVQELWCQLDNLVHLSEEELIALRDRLHGNEPA